MAVYYVSLEDNNKLFYVFTTNTLRVAAHTSNYLKKPFQDENSPINLDLGTQKEIFLKVHSKSSNVDNKNDITSLSLRS